MSLQPEDVRWEVSRLFVTDVCCVSSRVRTDPKWLDDQGVLPGGFSPIVLTSVSLVTVVVPPGPLIFVSFLTDKLSVLEHPIIPIELRLVIRVAAISRFIGLPIR